MGERSRERAVAVLAPITIGKSSTAGDYANVSRETLLASSEQHIGDISAALAAFEDYLREAAAVHDADKITGIDWFHRDFVTGFKETGWWDNHRRIWRHHLAHADGVPTDVNLLDVLEYIADCVMAGKARSGTVTPLVMPDEVLRRAFENTVSLLANAVTVEVPHE